MKKLNYKIRLDSYSRLRKFTEIFQAIGIKEDKRLTPKELDFFCNCVLLYNNGVNLYSSEAVKLLEKRMGFAHENRGAYIYRGRLKKKEWIQESDPQIPSTFIWDGQSKPYQWDINVNVDDLTARNRRRSEEVQRRTH